MIRKFLKTIGKCMAVGLAAICLIVLITGISKLGHAGSYTGQSAESVYSADCLAAFDESGLEGLLECVMKIYEDE